MVNSQKLMGQQISLTFFRPSNEAVEIANEAIKINAKVLWLQLNIKSPEAKKLAGANNIIYVENKCTKLEIEKYLN